MTPAQSRAARGLLRWSRSEAGKHAGIGRNTVQRFEDNENVYLDKVRALERAYAEAGVVFTGKTGTELVDSEGE